MLNVFDRTEQLRHTPIADGLRDLVEDWRKLKDEVDDHAAVDKALDKADSKAADLLEDNEKLEEEIEFLKDKISELQERLQAYES